MSAPTLTDTRIAVGQVGERATAFVAAHRNGNPPQATTVVKFTVPMSHEDIEAVLWRLLGHGGVTFADLDDDRNALWLLLDAILGAGVAAIESHRLDLADIRPCSAYYPDVLRLRRRVEGLIGPHPRRPRSRSGRAERGERSRGGNRAPLRVSHTTNPLTGTTALEGGRV